MEELLPINDTNPYVPSALFDRIDIRNNKFVTVDEIKKYIVKIDDGYEFMLENDDMHHCV